MEENKRTKLCKHCKTEIPYDAKICPNCRKKQTPGGCLIVILVVLVLVVLAAALGGKDTESKAAAPAGGAPAQQSAAGASTATDGTAAESEPASAAPEPEKETTSFGVGEMADQNNVCVTLVSAQESDGGNYMTPAEGNVFMLLEFEIENNTNADIAVSSMVSFEAYHDDYSMQESLTATASQTGKSTLDGTVAAGKKMNGVIGYEVPADWQEIEVRYSPSFWNNRAVTFIVPKEG